jgi:hypothetical protein
MPMARTTAWRSAAVAALAAAAFACKEQVTAPGHCPELCISDSLVVEDTVLTGIVESDTSLRGYTRVDFSSTLSIADTDSLTSWALVRFVALPQRWFPTATDTVLLGGIDSVTFESRLDYRDTTVHNARLVLYRLPATIDTLAKFDSVAPFFGMTPIDSVPLSDTLRSADLRHLLNVANVTPLAADSFVLAIGIAIRADAKTSARLLATDLTGFPPTLRFFVHGAAPRDTFKTSFALTPTFDTFVQNPEPAAPASGDIVIGNQPAARSFIRFNIPNYFIDSVNVVRATLLLTPTRPVRGIPGESVSVAAQPILKYFAGKSVLFQDTAVTGLGIVAVGQTTPVEIEIARVLRLWRGVHPDSLPRAVSIRNISEDFTTVQLDAGGKLAGAAAPRLQISYVRPFRFGVP